MKYYIEVEEIRSTVVEIEAASEKEAILKAEAAYYDNTICLDDAKYTNDGTEFSNETKRYKQLVENGMFTPQRIDTE